MDYDNIRLRAARDTHSRAPVIKLQLATRVASCVGLAARVGALRSYTLRMLAHLACCFLSQGSLSPRNH